MTQIQPLREYKVDICDFGVIKYEFEFSEFFDRPIPSLCVTIFSSDENARAQPEIIRNAKPGEIQSFNLLASWTDTNERPYIQICPCNEKCKENLFIDVVDDECTNESSQNFMESITASYNEKRNYVQSKMKFMFNNEEGLAQTSEILLQNCYRKGFQIELFSILIGWDSLRLRLSVVGSSHRSVLLEPIYSKLKDAGIVSCKILNMNTIGGDRKKRAGASSKSMTVGGTFKNASAAANISESSKALSEEVASAIIGSGEFSN